VQTEYIPITQIEDPATYIRRVLAADVEPHIPRWWALQTLADRVEMEGWVKCKQMRESIAELERDKDEDHDQIFDLEDTVTELEAQIEDRDAEIKRLRAEIRVLKKEPDLDE